MSSAISQVLWGAEELTPSWKVHVSTVCAYLTALLMGVAGAWKLTEIPKLTQMFEQLLIPAEISTFTVVAVAALELALAVLLVMPSTRRLGAWLASGMLIAYMLYMAVNYGRLQGEECSCFPWIKRSVGPAFFWSDAAMLVVSVLAGIWAQRLGGFKKAITITAICAALGVGAFAISEMTQSRLKAPETVLVDGQPLSLSRGKVFVYFFDPECMHCFHAAQEMAKWNWGKTKLVAVPTRVPQFAAGFLKDTKLSQAVISPDLEKLTSVFKFGDGPYGVALEMGRQKLAVTSTGFEGDKAKADLVQLGFVE
jgi:uncharacterized membrane protein YphA (DoxX/SURF4 family)